MSKKTVTTITTDDTGETFAFPPAEGVEVLNPSCPDATMYKPEIPAMLHVKRETLEATGFFQSRRGAEKAPEETLEDLVLRILEKCGVTWEETK